MPYQVHHARETDLGIMTWNFNEFCAPEVIEPHRLCGHFALAEIPLPNNHKAWATISLDHVSLKAELLTFLIYVSPSAVDTGARRRQLR